jgi:hypothetical protein
MKKTFILFLGASWSGTTSLYYTLKDEAKYMHGGWVKENMTLARIFLNEVDDKLLKRTKLCAYEVLLNSIDYINRTDECRDPILLKFTEKDLNLYFGSNSTLDAYVDYYKKLAEYCGDDIKAVGDFSNQNYQLTKTMLEQVKNALSDYFDIKVLFIFRDPIRRRWSQTCALTTGIRFPRRYELNSKIIDNFKSTNHSYMYAQKVKNAHDVFGKENVCYLIMEDFFKDEKDNLEVLKLEQFLNIKIPKVYPCAFVPDKGINAPKVEGLSDQWLSDTEILTAEVYDSVRYNAPYSQDYSEFEEFHGCLPADWGRPIDYGY